VAGGGEVTEDGSSGRRKHNPVVVKVEYWWWRLQGGPQWAVALGAVMLGGLIGRSHSPWEGIGVGLVFLVAFGVPNRYIIVEARLDDTLNLRFMDGRERVVDPSAVRLCPESFWRVPSLGGIPLKSLRGPGCVGVFYPTLGMNDVGRLDQWLG
jgi:hypothetical protein